MQAHKTTGLRKPEHMEASPPVASTPCSCEAVDSAQEAGPVFPPSGLQEDTNKLGAQRPWCGSPPPQPLQSGICICTSHQPPSRAFVKLPSWSQRGLTDQLLTELVPPDSNTHPTGFVWFSFFKKISCVLEK